MYNHEHESEINLFAATNFRNRRRRFGIKTDDRRRHMYVLGKTGMGKTTMLENMIASDINAGHGIGVVDPHGDMSEKILDFIPSHRINDIIYFNPADSEYPVGFNVLESVNPLHKHLVAQGLMGVFKKIWPDVWSARMEHILNNCILALLDYPGSTLLGINRILTDKVFRRRVIDKIRDPIVRAFWVDEYASWEQRFRVEAIQPIQNKVGQFLSASIIRNIVAQVKSTIDMREIMDSGKILIMNLAKGRLGEDTSRLLGGMLITKMQLAAMERVDITEDQRRDFYLYVDEFQNFATEAFANILSEARKYRLNLIIAHQYIGQLITETSTRVRDAVFGNVGTMVIFRIGAEDSEFVAKEFAPYFEEEDLLNLTKYDIYIKLMIDGVSSNPFSATTLAPIAEFQGNREKVIRISRERYAEPVAVVDEKVMRWAGMAGAEEGSEENKIKNPRAKDWSGEGGYKPAQSENANVQPARRRDGVGYGDKSGGPVGQFSAAPARILPRQDIQIQKTEPAPRVGVQAKPISLEQAIRQGPIHLKGGPSSAVRQGQNSDRPVRTYSGNIGPGMPGSGRRRHRRRKKKNQYIAPGDGPLRSQADQAAAPEEGNFGTGTNQPEA